MLRDTHRLCSTAEKSDTENGEWHRSKHSKLNTINIYTSGFYCLQFYYSFIVSMEYRGTTALQNWKEKEKVRWVEQATMSHVYTNIEDKWTEKCVKFQIQYR